MAADRPPREPHPALAAADRVAEIIAAAESAADELTRETEERMQARIAEGERAARYRIGAAEEEAEELVQTAQSEADRLLRDGRERDEAAKTAATNEALQTLASAQEESTRTLDDARASASRMRVEAATESRERLRLARETADAVRGEGLELVSNLRAMGDSLRTNAERLLRDVQSVHSQMIARIEVVEATRQADADRDPAVTGGSGRAAGDDGDVPDVPEFIPRR